MLDFICCLVYTLYIRFRGGRVMNTVKTRKVGNSLTVTIPKNLGMTEGQEMVVYKGIDGVIVLAPKLKDPFDGIADLRMTNDFEGVKIIDSEM